MITSLTQVSLSSPEALKSSASRSSAASLLAANLRGLLEHHHATIVPAFGALGRSRSFVLSPPKKRMTRTSLTRASLAAHPEPDVDPSELGALYRCVVHLLSASMKSREDFDVLLPLWTATDDAVSPTKALAGAAAEFERALVENEEGYGARRGRDELTASDEMHERVILALVALFVEKPESLTGFQNLVPRVFEVYLAR